MKNTIDDYLNYLSEQPVDIALKTAIPPTFNTIRKGIKVRKVSKNVFDIAPTEFIKKEKEKLKKVKKKKKTNIDKKIQNENKIIEQDKSQKQEIQRIRNFYKQKREEIDKNKASYIQKVKDYVLDLGDRSSEEIMDSVDRQKSKMFRYFISKKAMLNKQELNEIRKVIKGGKVISGLAMATIIIIKSAQIYQENSKRYEKQCSNKIGKEKKKCLLEIQLKLLKQRSEFLDVATTNCNKSSNPVDCKNRLDKEILRVRGKIKLVLDDIGQSMVS